MPPGFIIRRRLRSLIGPEHMDADETLLDYMPRVFDFEANQIVTLIATDKALYILTDLTNRRSGGRLPWAYTSPPWRRKPA